MKVLKKITVPTGDILIVDGEHGKLEMLSLADYGKYVNIKADFLGLTRKPKPVRHTALLPLEEKWVITVSTQYGCSMGCTFCDVPKVGPGKNATLPDLVQQVYTGLHLHPEIMESKRLNIHFARMGEPTWNMNVIEAALEIRKHLMEYSPHPVVSTMMPKKNRSLKNFIEFWMQLKNRDFEGNAGLQLSINSTDEAERTAMFSGNACTLEEIGGIMNGIASIGRKITLNFAVADYTINPQVLLKYFDPDCYVIKLTPMHKTTACKDSDIETEGDYTTYEPYEKHETALKAVGYDVLVFIASKEEDESKITCGNAILAERNPK